MSQIIAARFFELLDDFLGGLRRGHAGREGNAAAAGQERKPIELVSATIGRTRSTGMPRISAAIIAIEAREPPTSGVADRDDGRAVLVDMAGSARLAADIEPEPDAMPRP